MVGPGCGAGCASSYSPPPFLTTPTPTQPRFLPPGLSSMPPPPPLPLPPLGLLLQAVASRLVQEAFNRGSTDNLAAAVVDLGAQQLALPRVSRGQRRGRRAPREEGRGGRDRWRGVWWKHVFTLVAG